MCIINSERELKLTEMVVSGLFIPWVLERDRIEGKIEMGQLDPI